MPEPTELGDVDLCDCGWVRDSYACKLRHIQINTGDAKAAKD